MTTLTVKIDGLPQLQRALGAKFGPAMADATLGIAEQLENYLDKEPGVPIPANPRRWYERHYGPKWQSNPARRPKKLRGHIPPIEYGSSWAGYPSSETLFKAWSRARTSWGAILGNKATYAPAVQHYKEQTRKHKQTGWVTDKEAVDRAQRGGVIDRIVQMAVKRALGGR